MKKLELFKHFTKFQIEHTDALRNQIIEELYPDIFDIAKEQAHKLPENYEISDLFNAGVIAVLENLSSIKASNADEMLNEFISIIDHAIQQEIMNSIGPPAQTFINHEDAMKIQSEQRKKLNNINKGEDNEKEKGKQELE
ncbi:MAG: hypothetical protein K8S87_10585 [Planctomycetes bacterium]|nr:hypothetical protein [Planctomycetota bacterium]